MLGPTRLSWLEFEGKWGAFEDFNLSYSEKVEIIYSVADDCLLAIHLIHIPAACTGLCVVTGRGTRASTRTTRTWVRASRDPPFVVRSGGTSGSRTRSPG